MVMGKVGIQGSPCPSSPPNIAGWCVYVASSCIPSKEEERYNVKKTTTLKNKPLSTSLIQFSLASDPKNFSHRALHPP